MRTNSELTPSKLRELFDYDGAWLIRKATGKRIGAKNGRGYRCVFINGKSLLAHRIVWAHQKGYWPKEIDHINRDCSDNRLENLRECSHSRNAFNRRGWGKFPKGVSKLPGSRSKPFKAKIKINGKEKYLGTFSSPDEAHRVYLKALTAAELVT